MVQRRDRRALTGQLLFPVAAGEIARPGQAIGAAKVVGRGRSGTQPGGPIEDAQALGGFHRLREDQQQVVAAVGDPGLLGRRERGRQRVGQGPVMAPAMPGSFA